MNIKAPGDALLWAAAVFLGGIVFHLGWLTGAKIWGLF